MTTFFVSLKDPSHGESVDARIRSTFPSKCIYRHSTSVWFLKTELLSKDISEKLFPREPTTPPSHIVGRLDAYWGWDEKALWEWLSAP